ncbi:MULTISPECIES: hypothetical protein [unclassified Cupriavidus]|uniref:hypothetical protein n=1 Tax=unclassified Cupriavidus TaxID=2640874 RepID=UPI00313B6BDB
MNYPFSGILVRYRRNSTPNATDFSSKIADAARPNIEAAESDSTNAGDELGDELHVNLWEIGNERFLDVGVMVSSWNETDAVLIDVPWKLNISQISDLGARLNGERAIAAIFNEIVHYDGFADGNYAEISFRREDNSAEQEFGHFTLLRLHSQFFEIKDIYISDGREVSQLEIRLPRPTRSNKDYHRVYIRFRIRNVPEKMYASVFKQRDRNLLSSSTVTRIIDFRINVRRGMPDELLSGDEAVTFPRFAKIHCFLTTERGEDCIFQSKSFNGCRSLDDEDVWNEYIRQDSKLGISPKNSVRNYLGYQWSAVYKPSGQLGGEPKKPHGVKDLNVLGRFTKTHSSPFNILRFLILGLAFGIAGNGLWSAIEPNKNKNIIERVLNPSADDVAKLIGVISILIIASAIVLIHRETIPWLFRKIKAAYKALRDS